MVAAIDNEGIVTRNAAPMVRNVSRSADASACKN